MRITYASDGDSAMIDGAEGTIWTEAFTMHECIDLAVVLEARTSDMHPTEVKLTRRLVSMLEALSNDSAACIVTTTADLNGKPGPMNPADDKLVALLQAARNAAETCRDHTPDDSRGRGDADALMAAVKPFTTAAKRMPACLLRTEILAVTGENEA